MDYKGVKILIIEDEVLIAEVLKDHLLKLGFHFIKMAHDKASGLGMIHNWLPDAVILDIRMENRDDGLEIGKVIFKEYGIPFMYVTAHSDIEMTQKIIDTRPNGYVTKPIRINELMVNIRMLMDAVEKNLAAHLIKKDGVDTLPVISQNIRYLQASGNYWELVSYKKKYVVRMTYDE